MILGQIPQGEVVRMGARRSAPGLVEHCQLHVGPKSVLYVSEEKYENGKGKTTSIGAIQFGVHKLDTGQIKTHYVCYRLMLYY